MRRQILTSLAAFAALTLLLGFVYPLAVWAIGQVGFKDKADGSFVKVNGHVVGSKLLAQDFVGENYFHPRPSKAGSGYDGNGYDGTASAASNLGPTADKLIAKCLPVQATNDDGTPKVDAKGNPVYETDKNGNKVCDPNTVPQRVIAYREENGLAANASVPVDAVTASFSGLDPDISIANARIQAVRVAKVRGLSLATVLALVKKHTDQRPLGFLGEPGVNVLELNLALDRAHPSS
jgi:K+-transporting ATPase ATPase C chain